MRAVLFNPSAQQGPPSSRPGCKRTPSWGRRNNISTAPQSGCIPHVSRAVSLSLIR
jgi:hypothetical protein